MFGCLELSVASSIISSVFYSEILIFHFHHLYLILAPGQRLESNGEVSNLTFLKGL